MQSDNNDQEANSDYLYRVSLKALITNTQGEVLVVKETGKNYWDLPGGGIDHAETVEQALARELKEEVNYDGNLTYEVFDIGNPHKLAGRDMWQIRIALKVTPENYIFSESTDSGEVKFIDVELLRNSAIREEKLLYDFLSRK